MTSYENNTIDISLSTVRRIAQLTSGGGLTFADAIQQIANELDIPPETVYKRYKRVRMDKVVRDTGFSHGSVLDKILTVYPTEIPFFKQNDTIRAHKVKAFKHDYAHDNRMYSHVTKKDRALIEFIRAQKNK